MGHRVIGARSIRLIHPSCSSRWVRYLLHEARLFTHQTRRELLPKIQHDPDGVCRSLRRSALKGGPFPPRTVRPYVILMGSLYGCDRPKSKKQPGKGCLYLQCAANWPNVKRPSKIFQALSLIGGGFASGRSAISPKLLAVKPPRVERQEVAGQRLENSRPCPALQVVAWGTLPASIFLTIPGTFCPLNYLMVNGLKVKV